MIEINIKNNKLNNFKLEPGQLFVSRVMNSCFLLTTLKGGKYSLINIDGSSYWGGIYTFEEIEKEIIDDIILGRLSPVKNQKIIIEGEI